MKWKRLQGEKHTEIRVTLIMPSEFSKRVSKAAMSIPKGRVTTYGYLARAGGGGAQAARSITAVLAKSPDASKIPFHRIVYAGGKVWLSPEYENKRIALYKKEGIEIENGRIVDFRDKLYTFGFDD